MQKKTEIRLQQANAKLKQQLELSKKEVKSLKNKLSTSERKRKLLKEDCDKKKVVTKSYLYSLLNDINSLNL